MNHIFFLEYLSKNNEVLIKESKRRYIQKSWMKATTSRE